MPSESELSGRWEIIPDTCGCWIDKYKFYPKERWPEGHTSFSIMPDESLNGYVNMWSHTPAICSNCGALWVTMAKHHWTDTQWKWMRLDTGEYEIVEPR